MASWLWIAILAQFLSAVTVTIDKFLVSRTAHVGKPLVLTFYIAALGGFVVLLIPFGVMWPTSFAFFAALGSGVAFLTGLYFQYSTFQSTRVSDAAPVIGAISALTTLLLAFMWIDGDVTSAMLVPILLLIVGVGIISRMHFAPHALRYALFSGFCFGCMFFFTKLVFNEIDLLSGFFWTRVTGVAGAFALLAIPAARTAIFHSGKHASTGAKGLILASKGVGSISGILTTIAVSLGSVSVVNALSGVQFVFLFLFALVFATYIPRLKENSAKGHGGWHTLAGVSFIVVGLAALAYVH